MIGWPKPIGTALGTTMSPKTTRRSWMRLRAIPPIPFLIWVVGPAETYATSDHWATTSWVWTDRRNSWPWHAPIRSARFSTGFPRNGITEEPLRWHLCECIAVPRAEPGVAEGFGGTLRNLEAAGRPFLLKPQREQRGRLE